MSFSEMGAADIAAVTGNNNGMFGDGAWWIIILFLFVICGWGNNGWGNNGANSPGIQGLATRADINEGFAFNNLDNGIRSVQNGICDSTYALNNAITGGFSNLQLQLCNMSAQNQACCCETQRLLERGFADTNYNLATQACETRNTIQNGTRDIIENQNANSRAILDFLTNDKLSSLQAENAALKQNAFITANQEAQTAEIIRRLGRDCPQPAYWVQPPTPVPVPCGC